MNKMREAIRDTVQGLVDNDLSTSFTQKEMNMLGVKIKPVALTPEQIRAVRIRTNLSQTVFAQILSVSPSTVRQWEQGSRTPNGAAQVLLELMQRQPNVLDYRLH